MRKALVIFSGGQDSTTCLAWALDKFEEVFALSIDYGQHHKVELKQAKKIAKKCHVPHEIVGVDIFSKLNKRKPVYHGINIKKDNKGELPSTFVPGRNLIFLSIAAMKAYQLGIQDIVVGVCQTDFSDYPDSRKPFILSLERTTSLAMDMKFRFHCPLMNMTKAETVKLMDSLGSLDLLRESHTCYRGRRPACGICTACKFRLKGFEEAGIADPLQYECPK